MTMTREDVDTVILVAQVIFDNNSSSMFCSCWDGDLSNQYPDGVKEFLDALRGALTEIVEDQDKER